MKPHRLVLLAAVLGALAIGALAPAAGCAGTGTTPMCDFPDGANNPESGCGEIIEAAAADALPATADVVEEPAPSAPDASDASDATGSADAADAHATALDAADAPLQDVHSDVKG